MYLRALKIPSGSDEQFAIESGLRNRWIFPLKMVDLSMVTLGNSVCSSEPLPISQSIHEYPKRSESLPPEHWMGKWFENTPSLTPLGSTIA